MDVFIQFNKAGFAAARELADTFALGTKAVGREIILFEMHRGQFDDLRAQAKTHGLAVGEHSLTRPYEPDHDAIELTVGTRAAPFNPKPKP